MNSKTYVLFSLVFAALLLVSCAPNNDMFIDSPAGFWAGIWHGLILIITFIISLFSDSVTVYEINNSGNLYNLGFVFGILVSIGHCGKHCTTKQKKEKNEKEKEWKEIGEKVEEKVKRGIQNWLDETEKSDEDWEEIGRKVEEKIKRELKNWAEK